MRISDWSSDVCSSDLCLDPGQTPTERRDARNQLVTALADYALRHGIGEYVGVAEAGWYHTISKFGWTCRTLGPVHRDSACRIVALSIAIDEDTLPGLQDRKSKRLNSSH